MPFSADEATCLDQILDALIPPRDELGLPGAGGLGVGEIVRDRLGESADAFRPHLDWLAAQASARGASDFGALDLVDRAALLRDLDAELPGFVSALIFHTYGGYYQHPKVVEALGVPPRPPHPEGYPLEEGDLSGLEKVRGRSGLLREV